MGTKLYRSLTSGDRGHMVKKNGEDYIRLDRPNQVIERKYKEDEWTEESEHRPLLPMHITRMLFEAEKHLLIATGDQGARSMDWEMMTQNDRSIYHKAVNDSENKLVRRLHKAMRKVLDPLTE